MCDPVTIGGIAISALGTGVSAMQQNNAIAAGNKAREGAWRAEMTRQKGFQEQAAPVFQSAVENQGAEKSLGDLLTAQTARSNEMAGAVEQPGSYAPAPGTASGEVGRLVVKAASEARDNAMRAGALGGWGDLGFNQGMGMQETGRQMGNIADAAGGSVRLLPMEQDVAQYNASRQPAVGLGDLLTLAGKGTMLAGATGFNPFRGRPGVPYSGGTFTNPVSGLRVGGV